MTVILRVFGALMAALTAAALAGGAMASGVCLPAPDAPPFRILTEAPASGAPVTLAWADPAPDPHACAGARFLVLAMPPEVRFSGNGFLALMPGAEAPFDLTHRADLMRVVIALHDPDHRSGTLALTPYLTGDLAIDWAVVQVPPADASTVRQAVTGAPVAIALATGRPRLVVQDPFDTTPPDARILSNDGAWLLEVLEGRFRVLDARTGALVHAGAGFEPNFSPASRFVHAVGPPIRVEDGFSHLRADLVVVDLVAEREVLRLGGTGGARSAFLTALHWGAGDSFLVVGFAGDGGIGFAQPLHDDRPLVANHLGCGACSAADGGLAEWHRDTGLLRLGTREGARVLADLLDLHDPRRHRLFDVDAYASPEPPAPPLPEAVRRIDPGAADGRSWALQTPGDARPPAPVVTHRPVADRALNERLSALVQAGSGQTRGAVALGAAASVNALPRALVRLQEFGLATAAPPPLLPMLDDRTRAGLELLEDDPEWDLVAFYDDDGNPDEEVLRAHAARPQECEAGLTARQAGQLGADQARALCAAESLALHDAGFSVCHPSEEWVWVLAVDGRVTALHQRICRMGTASGAHGLLTWMHHDRSGPRAALLSGAPMLFDDPFGEFFDGPDPESAVDPTPFGLQPMFADAPLAVFALAPDRLAIAGRDRQIVVIDPRDPQAALRIAGPTAADDIETLRLTADGRSLLQLDADGQFHLFALDGGAPVLAGRLVDDEIVVLDDALRFDSTPEGAGFVQVKFPGDGVLFPLSNLAAQRRVPGLVAAHLGQAGPGVPLAPVAPIGLPPRLEVLEQDAGSVTLRLIAPGGLAALALHRDGQRLSETPLTGQTAELTLALTALPETRWFALQLSDAAGLQSRAVVLAHAGAGAPQGRLQVLAVGTDRYDDPAIGALRFAAADARAFAGAFAAGGRYGAVEAETMIDHPDLAEALLARLAVLAQTMRPEDTLFLHIAAHGYADAAGRLHLAHRTTRLADLAGTALAFDRLAEALAALPGRVVVFLDACHAGAAAGMSNDDAVDVLIGGALPLAVLAASKGRQVSFEGSAFRGGAFTGAIVAALADPATDLDGNGVVELDELYARIKAEVVHATAGEQTPWIARSSFVGPVPLF